jgi:hypothetical protein
MVHSVDWYLNSPNFMGQAVQVCSYIGNGVDGDWVSENVMLAKGVSVA